MPPAPARHPSGTHTITLPGRVSDDAGEERRMSSAEVTLHIPGDLVDERGQAIIAPEINVSSTQDVNIAPWEEPPSPPPKASRSFGFSQKPSFSSLVTGNSSGLLSRSNRPSQTSVNGFSDSMTSLAGPSSLDVSSTSSLQAPQPELRKQKSSMFSNLMKKRSNKRLRSNSDDTEHPSLRPVAPPLPDNLVSILPLGPGGPLHPSLLAQPKESPKSKGKRRAKDSQGTITDEPPPPPPKDPELKLDTNFDDIDRIVDRSYSQQREQGQVHQPGGSMRHGRQHSSDNSVSSRSLGASLPSIAQSEFHNPFSSYDPSAPPRPFGLHPLIMERKVSPKTIVPGDSSAPSVNGHGEATAGLDLSGDGNQRSPSWVPPESWAVEKDGEEDPAEEYSSSEDSVLGAVGTGGGRPLQFSKPVRRSNSLSEDSPGASGTEVPHTQRFQRLKQDSSPPTLKRPPSSASTGTMSTSTSGERKRSGGPFNGIAAMNMKRKKSKPGIPELVDGAITPKRPESSSSGSGAKNYTIRIYRHNHSYHMVQVGFQVTVANLIPKLNAKLLLGEDRESHKLYLKERGRERILANTERPADIVRRRLEQAGYDPSDCQDILAGDGLLFLLKFVYKSQLLGPEEDLGIENFTGVNLTGRSLQAIPVPLHKHADMIVSLNLARNPMLEIPLDFIQSCTNLRDLRLSNMALKKVPHSVRHSRSLRELDISCNRIADLDEAYLDHIEHLDALLMQNNRMEKLPWYFPRVRKLVKLNMSNNKFKELPVVVCELENLRDLDISFNLISELPEELGKLDKLERFTMVGNKVKELPAQCAGLTSLRFLDCRRNDITDVSIACTLPQLEKLHADHNRLHALDLSLGSHLAELDVSHNEITQLSLVPGPVERAYSLTSLDISHAQLYWLDEAALAQLTSLQNLKLDHNQLRVVPESLGELQHLEMLSCADNNLKELPKSIGRLQKLKVLDAHANSLTELPDSLWYCGSLTKINATSNLIVHFHTPPIHTASTAGLSSSSGGASMLSTSNTLVSSSDVESDRKASLSSVNTLTSLHPLAYSLERLYLGENQFTDEVLPPLMILRELRVLNLSFNDISELPGAFFKSFAKLEELYLSGNKLTSIPTEDLPKLTRLSVLFLNGNRLQTLPHELGKVMSLTVLDVGSNLLRYNINNWEFDWNWNFNKNLKYLNLSGNKRLQIKSDVTRSGYRYSRDLTMSGRQSLAGFTELQNLRVLGLMDVTISATGHKSSVDIPDETDDRRVRTSMSTINGMAYGIADTLGKNDHLHMLDLVYEFRERKGEAVFAMFGRSEPPKNLNVAGITHTSNRLARFLHDHFIPVFSKQLQMLQRNEDPRAALRRSFLHLNQELHDFLFSTKVKRKMSGHSGGSGGSSSRGRYAADHPTLRRTGASGVVLYFVDKRMYVANAGNALSVVSRGGSATLLSRKHDPYDRQETARIRGAEGWISPPGLVNDEIDLSRSFGFFHLMPMLNARPDVQIWDLSELDEFVIVANRGLWDFVSYQTAVDIARREQGDPMIAAQKLRDFAVSYGASGSTMIMVIAVGDLFKSDPTSKAAQQSAPGMESIADSLSYKRLPPRRPRVLLERDEIVDRGIRRLPEEVSPPTGHIALVFTDIRNSTHLWEVNPGMPTAMRLHNNLLRRQLRFCGGYEVKTEGDSFMCSFPSALSALWWCLTVQVQLLREPWPLEILEAPDGKEIRDLQGKVVAKGLSVRMGIHCGTPFCEPDPITKRMDYIGPMVNRAARIESRAAGGEIMCSADVIQEINAKIFGTGAETQFSELQAPEAIDAIKRLGVVIVPVGEIKLKGLEVPEMLSKVYPSDLEGRRFLDEEPVEERDDPSGSRIPFSVDQMRELGMMCLRLEALSQGRIFRTWPERKGSQARSLDTELSLDDRESSTIYLFGDPSVLLPPMSENSSDEDMMLVMDSLSGRIDNAIASLLRKTSSTDSSKPEETAMQDKLVSALNAYEGLDPATLETVFKVMASMRQR